MAVKFVCLRLWHALSHFLGKSKTYYLCYIRAMVMKGCKIGFAAQHITSFYPFTKYIFMVLVERKK